MIYHILKIKEKKHLILLLLFSLLNITLTQAQEVLPDFDGDGVPDIFDVDDDNDGIFDHIESPDCFHLDKAAFEAGGRTLLFGVTSSLTTNHLHTASLVDGTDQAIFKIDANVSIAEKEIFRITSVYDYGIKFTSLLIKSSGTILRLGQYRVEGKKWNNDWVTLTDGNVTNNLPNGTNIIFEADKIDFYKSYRLVGVEGTTYEVFILEVEGVVASDYHPSLYPKLGDGECVPNKYGIFAHQSLDADGDGCPDIYEAGFTTELEKQKFEGTVASGAIKADGSVIDHDYQQLPYEYYKIKEISLYTDFDGDGVPDIFDIDADNDGILNHIESPDYFEADKSVYEAGDRTGILGVSSTLPIISGSLDQLLDGVTTGNMGISLAAQTEFTDQELFRVMPILARGIEYESITMSHTGTFAMVNSEVQLQGFDGASWTPLVTQNLLSNTAASNTFSIPIDKQSSYRAYRLMGISGSTTNAVRWITEITGVVGKFNPSQHPKRNGPEGTNKNGIPSYLNLDFDGDGCPDIYEAGFTTELGKQKFEGTVASGKIDLDGGVIEHDYQQLPFEYYKIKEISLCTDTDGDGVPDLFDIDADNDGILNHIESPSCFHEDKAIYETGDRIDLLRVSTTLPYTGSLDLLVNGITTNGTGILLAAKTEFTGRELFRIMPVLARGVEYESVTMNHTATFAMANSEVQLQGFDGTSWIPLVSQDLLSNTAVSNTFSIPIDKQSSYQSYRLMGVSGSTVNAARWITEITGVVGKFNPSLHPKKECLDDIDGDKVPNHLDLDSDGDGCPDIYEAGFTTELGKQKFEGTVASGAIRADGSVIAHDYQKIALSYYKTSAVSLCADTDGDGVPDALDVDADNDGILNHIESPNSFYTDKLVYETGDRRGMLGVSTTLPYTGNLDLLVDGINTANTGILLAAQTQFTGQELFRIMPTLSRGIEYESITIGHTGSFAIANSEVQLEGFDGVSWIPLATQNLLTSTALSNTFLIPEDKRTNYQSYRLMGNSGATPNAIKWITEITGVVGNYNPSLFPKLGNAASDDIDANGVPNHLDLDSDGDGCSDIYEAGFTTELGKQKFEGTVASGAIKADGSVIAHDYQQIPYEYYKIKAISLCADTDGDGVADVLDVDADNDGIFNHIESPNSFHIDKSVFEDGDRRDVLGISTDLPYTGSLDLLFDGVVTNGTGISLVGQTEFSGKELFRIMPKLSQGIEYESITMSHTGSFAVVGSEVQLEGFDGVTWIPLVTQNLLTSTAVNNTFSIPESERANYKSYRLMGVSGSTPNAVKWITEITGVVGNYNPSLHPKVGNADDVDDIDKDDVPNHLDFDSDGDDCPDIYEAGFTTEVGKLKFEGTVATGEINPDGSVIAHDYQQIPYNFYKTSSVSLCKDTDGDGVPDALDVDADNDGIFNHIESPNSFDIDKSVYETGDRKDILGVSTTLPYTGSLNLLLDGVTTNGTGILLPALTQFDGEEIFRIMPTLSLGIEYESITMNHTGSFAMINSEVQLEGFDGTSWTTLVKQNLLTNSSVSNTFSIPVDKRASYESYRLKGISGSTVNAARWITEITGVVGNYNPSLFPKLGNATSDDIDANGVPNHLDLDSDDDGCPDIYEAGFTKDKNIQKFEGTVLSGKINPDGSVIGHDYQQIPYEYYRIKAIKLCDDTDGDGVPDVLDIDADNDGIFNHVESPNCFYSDKSVYEAGDRRSLVGISTTLPYNGSLDLLLDGLATANTGISITGQTQFTGQELFRIKPLFSLGIEYESITMSHTGSFAMANSEVQLEGFNGTSWVSLVTQNLLTTSVVSNTFLIPADKRASYQSYRLVGISGSTPNVVKWITEVTGIVGRFNPSQHPKMECGDDIDEDGIPNHIDLDSDGDGAYDIYEAGFTKDKNIQKFEGTVASGAINSDGSVIMHDYLQMPYEYYKIKELVLSTDTDGDGVVDMFDSDADNDGILNHVESPNCFYTHKSFYETDDRRGLLGITSTLAYTGSLDLLLDGLNTASTGVLLAAQTQFTGQELFRIMPILSQEIEYESITMNHTGGFAAANSDVQLEGLDGTTWVPLLTQRLLTTTAVSNTFSIPEDKRASYRAYRLMGISGSTPNAVRWITEISGVVGNYDPSQHPRLECGDDLDGDGIPNHLDLDSDGDDCYDVVEAGFLDLDGDGMLGQSPVVVDRLGRVMIGGTVNYTSPKYLYYLDSSVSFCDMEEIPDDGDLCLPEDAPITNDYDMAQSTFHSSIVRSKSSFMIFGSDYANAWGAGTVFYPTAIEADNIRNDIEGIEELDAADIEKYGYRLPRSEADYIYNGKVLDATLGGHYSGSAFFVQNFVLSTDGIYAWGTSGLCVPSSLTPRPNVSGQKLMRTDVDANKVIIGYTPVTGTISANGMQKLGPLPGVIPAANEGGLPDGVSATDIKKISASFGMLSILTHGGDVYTMQSGDYVGTTPADYGDGSTVRDKKWHKANVSHVVSLKHTSFAKGSGAGTTFMALTISGDLYTWGTYSYLGDDSERASYSMPQKMTLPKEMIDAKTKVQMISVAGTTTYLLLSSDGKVYSLGINTVGILGIGIGNSTAVTTWQKVLSPKGGGAQLSNIKFINAISHDTNAPAAGAIDKNGVPYLWGSNDGGRLAGPSSMGIILAPRIPDGVYPGVMNIIYVELGGHVTPIVDKASAKFGYTGHKTEGSMGNGPGGETIYSYDFENTPVIDFCNVAILSNFIPVNPMLRIRFVRTTP